MKKSFLKKVLCLFSAVSMVNLTCTKSFAFSSYQLFRVYDKLMGESRNSDCMEPVDILDAIDVDNVDALETNLQRYAIAPPSIVLNMNMFKVIGYSLGKCAICFATEQGCDIFNKDFSLLDYALSKGSSNCVEYLLAIGVMPISGDYDDVIAAAVISGNAELVISLLENFSVNVNALYTAMRTLYFDETEEGIEARIRILDIIVTRLKDEGYSFQEDELEKAFAFLLLAEREIANRQFPISDPPSDDPLECVECIGGDHFINQAWDNEIFCSLLVEDLLPLCQLNKHIIKLFCNMNGSDNNGFYKVLNDHIRMRAEDLDIIGVTLEALNEVLLSDDHTYKKFNTVCATLEILERYEALDRVNEDDRANLSSLLLEEIRFVSKKNLERFINAGVDVNIRNYAGETMLTRANEYHYRSEISQMLIDAGATE